MQITEMHKQSPSNSGFKGNQNLTWNEMFAHKFFFRDEKDYTYFFLGIGNDNDTKVSNFVSYLKKKGHWKSDRNLSRAHKADLEI